METAGKPSDKVLWQRGCHRAGGPKAPGHTSGRRWQYAYGIGGCDPPKTELFGTSYHVRVDLDWCSDRCGASLPNSCLTARDSPHFIQATFSRASRLHPHRHDRLSFQDNSCIESRSSWLPINKSLLFISVLLGLLLQGSLI